ncbi:hypothetical protein DY000_02059817 [Brassica cretica]|uniref:Uncharacterized protein n=1 Tax=Brassica cretica TaxID=69181 RepID=A0ABQ7AQK7_BRACR|nr:hypothetical protein DY000_02059817 [Brassica cretica]
MRSPIKLILASQMSRNSIERNKDSDKRLFSPQRLVWLFRLTSWCSQHQWRPKSFITVSGEVDSRAIEKSAKIGLGCD